MSGVREFGKYKPPWVARFEERNNCFVSPIQTIPLSEFLFFLCFWPIASVSNCSPLFQHDLHDLCEELCGYGQTSPSLRELPGTSYAFGDLFFSWVGGVSGWSDFELLCDVSHQNCTCAKMSAVSAADSCVRVECGMILLCISW